MKYKHILFTLLIPLFWAGCTDLEELNVNPNQPEEVSASVLLTSAMRSSMNSMVMESFLLGNNAAQLTAKTLRAEIDIYNWNAFPTVWEEMYKSLANVAEAERIAIEEGNANMEAVAIVMKSWIFSILTDAYGDIPYSEAIKGASEGNYLPAYDAQEDIYTGPNGLLAELARAEGLFNANDAVDGDLLYDGDVAKWKKLCNSLHLRLLMRVSGKVDVSGDFSRIVSDGDIMTSNADNAVLDYQGNFPNTFPLLPLKLGDFDAVVMSERSVSVMLGYNDPRLMAYARPDNLDFENPVFDGAVNGSENPDECDKSGSRLGLAYFDYPGHPTVSDHANGILMTYSEVEFLIAEAIEKGITTGDAETHYKNGIQASMDHYEVDYAPFGYSDFEDYYANSGVAYSGERIQLWEQKWLSLFFTGLEPYFEVRRWLWENDFEWAAVPFVGPTCQNVNNDNLPVRFPYPGDEQSLNVNNYQAAIERLGSNSQNARMWLME